MEKQSAAKVVLNHDRLIGMSRLDLVSLMAPTTAGNPETPVILRAGNAEVDLALSALRMRGSDSFGTQATLQSLRFFGNVGNEKGWSAAARSCRQQPEQELVGRLGQMVQAMERRNLASREIIERLAAATEVRDQETGEHITRIGHYAGMISRELGLPEYYTGMIEQAATMHDIGKIGIPDSILLKPGSLTSQEFEIMKTHTVLGEEILSGTSSPLLQMALSIALTHHERWDGSGYPHGLAGEEIPLAGRIVMLADQYDALRSRRVYKPSLDHAATCAILSRGDALTRPDHFDPRILKTFLKMEPSFAEAFPVQKKRELPARRTASRPFSRTRRTPAPAQLRGCANWI